MSSDEPEEAPAPGCGEDPDDPSDAPRVVAGEFTPDVHQATAGPRVLGARGLPFAEGAAGGLVPGIHRLREGQQFAGVDRPPRGGLLRLPDLCEAGHGVPDPGLGGAGDLPVDFHRGAGQFRGAGSLPLVGEAPLERGPLLDPAFLPRPLLAAVDADPVGGDGVE